MEFSFAQNKDTAAVRQLWDICFGDEGKYTDVYFSRMYKPESTCVARDGDKVISSLQMFPHTLYAEGKTYSSMYIGGVDTLPAYRGQGIATRLIAFAEEEMRKQATDISFLVPISSVFYHRMGYRPVSYLSEITGPMSSLASFSDADIPCFSATIPPVSAYEEFTRQFRTYLVRDEKRYSEEIFPLSEAGCYTLPGNTGYILFSIEGDTITGWECAYKDEHALRTLLGILYAKHTTLQKFRLRVPADGTARKIMYDTTITETRRLHAMAKSLKPVVLPACMENYINMIGWF